MAEVFIAPTGELSSRAISDLRKAGIVVVEAEHPERCTFIRSSEVVSGDDMLWAALDALGREGHGKYGDDSAKKQREQLAFNLLSVVAGERKRRRAATSGPASEVADE